MSILARPSYKAPTVRQTPHRVSYTHSLYEAYLQPREMVVESQKNCVTWPRVHSYLARVRV